mmetsp:Transcript_113373/g.315615  ORF Transcript_113373/g.315615 Transcript_113373/m.315615 type:complete len:465 (-) Transcript_113373:550-1944(-)
MQSLEGLDERGRQHILPERGQVSALTEHGGSEVLLRICPRWLFLYVGDRPSCNLRLLACWSLRAQRRRQRRGGLPAREDPGRVGELRVDAVQGRHRSAAVEAGEELLHTALAVWRGGGAEVVAPGQHEGFALQRPLAEQHRITDARGVVLPHEDQASTDGQQLLIVCGRLGWYAAQHRDVLALPEEAVHLRLCGFADHEDDALDARAEQLLAEPADRGLHRVAQPDWEEPGPSALRSGPHVRARTSNGNHSIPHGLLRSDRQGQGLHAQACHDLHDLILGPFRAAEQLCAAVPLRTDALAAGDVWPQCGALEQAVQCRRPELVGAEGHRACVPTCLGCSHEGAQALGRLRGVALSCQDICCLLARGQVFLSKQLMQLAVLSIAREGVGFVEALQDFLRVLACAEVHDDHVQRGRDTHRLRMDEVAVEAHPGHNLPECNALVEAPAPRRRVDLPTVSNVHLPVHS